MSQTYTISSGSPSGQTGTSVSTDLIMPGLEEQLTATPAFVPSSNQAPNQRSYSGVPTQPHSTQLLAAANHLPANTLQSQHTRCPHFPHNFPTHLCSNGGDGCCYGKLWINNLTLLLFGWVSDCYQCKGGGCCCVCRENI